MNAAAARPAARPVNQPEAAQPAPAPQRGESLRTLRFGEAVPLAYSATRTTPRFAFGSLGGRYTLLGFLPPAKSQARTAMLAPLEKARKLFDPSARVIALADNAPGSLEDPHITAIDGSLLVFHDQQNGLHDIFGVAGAARTAGNGQMPHGWFLIDPVMRVMAVFAADQTANALDVMERLPAPLQHAGVATPAPVMIVPRVFEPEFCKVLMDHYHAKGGQPSGVTRERDGRTLVELDTGSKKRFDCTIEDEALRQAAMHRIYWRLAPQIEKAYQFKVSRMERYIVCCYDAQTGGFFKAHRDNTTKGTAHRRFAVSINLNAEDFGGGGVTFPEYSNAVYNPPTGGALIFSCSILHEALPITSGQRFAFLPFLYDDAAAQVRKANNAFLGESVGSYDS